jgi:hypothetical protein
MIRLPVVLVGLAASREHFDGMAPRRQPGGDLPGVLFGAAGKVAPEPRGDDPQFHRFFGL